MSQGRYQVWCEKSLLVRIPDSTCLDRTPNRQLLEPPETYTVIDTLNITSGFW